MNRSIILILFSLFCAYCRPAGNSNISSDIISGSKELIHVDGPVSSEAYRQMAESVNMGLMDFTYKEELLMHFLEYVPSEKKWFPYLLNFLQNPKRLLLQVQMTLIPYRITVKLLFQN